MAAAVRLLSVAREEIPLVAGEIASTARASSSSSSTSSAAVAVESTASSAIRAGEMNPMAVRQMAEMSVKEAGESSILGQHLSIARSQVGGVVGKPTPGSGSLLETISHSRTPLDQVTTTSTTTAKSVIAQTLEMDAGVSIKEAISNAGQTGVEEVVEQLGEIGKIMLAGGMTVPKALPKV